MQLEAVPVKYKINQSTNSSTLYAMAIANQVIGETLDVAYCS